MVKNYVSALHCNFFVDLAENSFDQGGESEQIDSENENLQKISKRRKFSRRDAKICSTNEEDLMREEFFALSNSEGDDEKGRRKKSRKEKKVRKSCECCNQVRTYVDKFSKLFYSPNFKMTSTYTKVSQIRILDPLNKSCLQTSGYRTLSA